MYTKLFLSSLCLVVIISNLPSCLQASKYENDSYWVEHADEFDDYWKQRAKEAEKFNKEAYCPNPYELTGNFTTTVKESIAGNKSVRRNLKGKIFGPCMATNPIDSCWRCDPNWHKHRERLADCVKGFGRKTTGGKGGKVYIVTDPSDDELVWPKVGTLRHAVTRKEPLWIIFSRSMTIRLQQELIVASDKTIDGRGVDVYIANGAGFMLQFVRNVIIHGIKIYNIKAGQGGTIRSTETNYGTRTPSDGDGISIFGSSNIWIDHVSMKNCADGLIDAIMGSTAITISNSHFTDHNDVMLFGASDAHTADVIMQITLAFNHFGKRLIQRMPRVRYGFVHVVNNDYTHWEMYAIGGSMHPTIISEGNRYIAPDMINPNINAKEITHRSVPEGTDWSKWQWRSINDERLNGAYFVESGSELLNRPFSVKDMITAKPASFVGRLTRNAGILRCRPGKPC